VTAITFSPCQETIVRPFDAEAQRLKDRLLSMGELVEKQIVHAKHALLESDKALANKIIANDHKVNAMDVEIDEAALQLLALHNPTARDLRSITTAMKIATELERISDLAENICERVIELADEPKLKPYTDISQMAESSIHMVKGSLQSFVNEDSTLARQVCDNDDLVDNLTEQVFRELLSFMLEEPKSITRGIRVMFVAKYIERIADHATNIAELVVYLVEGKIIRHTT
jgi:phosphate transport system protein|tara:strand:+ start:2779 stop:3468 length:690 start_codon:yes stop_codon:yes gene_type:complete